MCKDLRTWKFFWVVTFSVIDTKVTKILRYFSKSPRVIPLDVAFGRFRRVGLCKMKADPVLAMPVTAVTV